MAFEDDYSDLPADLMSRCVPPWCKCGPGCGRFIGRRLEGVGGRAKYVADSVYRIADSSGGQRSLAFSRILTLSAGGAAAWAEASRSPVAIGKVAFLFAIALYAAAPAFVAEKVGAERTSAFDLELRNSQSELTDYLIKRRGRARA
jgi:hypothetical protein